MPSFKDIINALGKIFTGLGFIFVYSRGRSDRAKKELEGRLDGLEEKRRIRDRIDNDPEYVARMHDDFRG